jgi:hypothetical protein
MKTQPIVALLQWRRLFMLICRNIVALPVAFSLETAHDVTGAGPKQRTKTA